MHVIFRETLMEETAIPQDLGQEPADLVVLSFSDSDHGCSGRLAPGASGSAFPSLRLANLAALIHPLSVDTYIEKHGRGKGRADPADRRHALLELRPSTVETLARSRGLRWLSCLPMVGRIGTSTVSPRFLPPLAKLCQLCDEGGAAAARAAWPPSRTPQGLASALRRNARLCRNWRMAPSCGIIDPRQLRPNADRPLILIASTVRTSPHTTCT